MYVAETTFVWKIRTFNVDEIDTWLSYTSNFFVKFFMRTFAIWRFCDSRRQFLPFFTHVTSSFYKLSRDEGWRVIDISCLRKTCYILVRMCKHIIFFVSHKYVSLRCYRFDKSWWDQNCQQHSWVKSGTCPTSTETGSSPATSSRWLCT